MLMREISCKVTDAHFRWAIFKKKGLLVKKKGRLGLDDVWGELLTRSSGRAVGGENTWGGVGRPRVFKGGVGGGLLEWGLQCIRRQIAKLTLRTGGGDVRLKTVSQN